MSVFSEKLPDHNPQWLFDENNKNLKKLKKSYAKDSAPKLAQVSDLISPLANKVNETSVLHQFIKLVKHSTECVIILWENLKAKEAFLYCSVFSDAIKSLGVVNGIKTIIQNGAVQDLKGIKLHERNLGISYGFFETISGGFSFINLLDHFKLLGIAELSLSIGAIPLLPFQLAGCGIDLIKSGIEVANGALRIYQTNESKTKLKAKKKQFRTNKTGDIDAFLKNHLAEMEQKQTNTLNNVTVLEGRIKDTHASTDKALQDYTKAAKDFKDDKSVIKTTSRWEFHKKEAALFAAKKEHDQVIMECESLRAKFEARALKWTVWSALDAHHIALLTDHKHAAVLDVNGNLAKFTLDDQDPLKRLVNHKQEKWKKQLSNCNWSTALDAVGISLHTVMSTTIVASSILALTGIGAVPALLTMASMSLLTSFGGLALELLKDYRSPHDVPKTNFNDYKLDPTKHGFSIHPDPVNPTYI